MKTRELIGGINLLNVMYKKVFFLNFQNQMEYKVNFLMSFILKLIPFGINLLIWLTVFAGNHSYEMSKNEILTYYFVNLIVTNLIGSSIQYEISDDIRSGNINKYIVRPISYFKYHFFKDLSNKVMFVILGTLPIIVICLILYNKMLLIVDLLNIIAFIISIIIGYIINFILTFVIGELSFYFTNVTSLFTAYSVLRDIVSGAIVPLSLFPQLLSKFLLILPFGYVGYIPSIMMIRVNSYKILFLQLVIGVFWIGILYFAHKILWKRGLKKYAAFGG